MRFLLILISTLSLSLSATSAERRHKLKLKGEVKKAGQVLTVEDLKKDFPELKKLKTAFRDEKSMDYEGVTVADLVAKYGKDGVTKVKVKATNNYEQTLDQKDIKEWNAFMAFIADGKDIPTATRGTFRVIYDYEKFKGTPIELNRIESASVWQVVEIEFIK